MSVRQQFEVGKIEKKIRGAGLREVRKRYMERYHKDEKTALLAESEFCKFATLHILEPDLILAPSGFVDEFWHEYVLDTKGYRQFCKEVFGSFWEHDPKVTAEEAMPFYQKTLDAYERYFDEKPNVSAWGPTAVECSCGYAASS